MKKVVAIGCAVFIAVMFLGLASAQAKAPAKAQAKTVFKAGDEVYVCGCGEGCKCLTMSHKAGTCACGKDLVKATIDKVEKGKATVMVNGKAQVFKTTGKYVCACAGCNCDTVSQKPGKCSCGKPLKAKAAKAKAEKAEKTQ